MKWLVLLNLLIASPLALGSVVCTDALQSIDNTAVIRKAATFAEFYKDDPETIEALAEFDKLSPKDKNRFIIAEFRAALDDAYGLLSKQDLDLFRRMVKNFADDGGSFNIPEDDTFHDMANFRILRSGRPLIQVSAGKLIQSHAEIRENRKILISSIAHELRHYVTTKRIATRLQENGMKPKDAWTFGHRLEEKAFRSFVNHVDQMENEAVAFESHLFPDYIAGDLKRFIYPTAETLARFVIGFQKAHPNIEMTNDPQLIRIADQIITELGRFIDLAEKNPKAGVNLEAYVVALRKGKHFAYSYIMSEMINYTLSSVQFDINEPTGNSLRRLLTARSMIFERALQTSLDRVMESRKSN